MARGGRVHAISQQIKIDGVEFEMKKMSNGQIMVFDKKKDVEKIIRQS